MEAERRKPPILRYLRIAFSAICGIACVLLVVLSVRSARSEDQFGWTITQRHYFSINSAIERVSFSWTVADNAPHFPQGFFVVQTIPEWFTILVRGIRKVGESPENAFGFKIVRRPQKTTVSIPYLWLAVLFASIAAVPWIKRRFSLRAVLIATTLVAVALGIAAISN